MKVGSRFRVAFAAVALLAQLVLPVAHGVLATTHPASGSDELALATADGSHIAAHDPSLCPICVAACQARTGMVRALPQASLRFDQGVRAEPVVAPIAPQAPDLAAAAPRAPPVLSLAFA